MSQAGWYPDPGGQAGRFRYWDGHAWSAATTTNPATPPPISARPPSGPTGPALPSGQRAPSGQQGGPRQGQATAYQQYQQQAKKKSTTGWWIAGGAVLLAIILLAVFGIRALIGHGNEITNNPGGQGSEATCPTNPYTQSPEPQPNDGRVHGGQLSYPVLGAPWSPPAPGEDRLPFATDVLTQMVEVQPNYDKKGHSWVASVLIGELVAGDGFFSPEEGSKIVTKCIVGIFYGDNPVVRHDKVNKATTVDGKDAWLVESHLTFNIPNLKTKGELMIVMIVATSQASSSIFYASIPDTVPQLVAPAENAMKGLKVEA